jgi:hypothetical protein
VNTLDRNSMTPLIICAYHGDVNMLRYLLKHGANVNLTDRMNTSALDCACMRLNTEVIKELIRNGCKCNTCTPFTFFSPLKHLAFNKEYTISRMLIESGYDLKHERWINQEAQRDESNEFVKWLLKYKQNPLSLLSLSRLKIRDTMLSTTPEYFEDKINRLRIPKLLKDYLMIKN